MSLWQQLQSTISITHTQSYVLRLRSGAGGVRHVDAYFFEATWTVVPAWMLPWILFGIGMILPCLGTSQILWVDDGQRKRQQLKWRRLERRCPNAWRARR